VTRLGYDKKPPQHQKRKEKKKEKNAWRESWLSTVPRTPCLFTGHSYWIFKEFSLKLRPRKLRNLQLFSIRTALLPLFLRTCAHFYCIHSFHCLLFMPLSLLFSPRFLFWKSSQIGRNCWRALWRACAVWESKSGDEVYWSCRQTSHSGYFRFPFFEFVLGRLYAEFVQDLISEYGHPKISHGIWWRTRNFEEAMHLTSCRKGILKSFWSRALLRCVHARALCWTCLRI